MGVDTCKLVSLNVRGISNFLKRRMIFMWEFVHFTLQDVLTDIITSKCPLLNYLLLIAKVYLWDCRRSETLPNITGLKLKVKNKYETEKYICIKNNTIEKFTTKWALTSGSVLL